jgi:predicted N-acetyltransferase YhbS
MSPATTPTPDLEHLCRVFSAYRYNFQDETSLQEGMALALTRHGIAFEREVRLDAKNRPDFMLGPVAVEVKIKGSFAEFMRQAQRYLALEQISALIVVGTPKWLPAVPATLEGKPVYTVRLTSSLL